MQTPRPAIAPGVAVALLTRPSPGPHVIGRPPLLRRLDDLVERHRITLVLAPAGYGKTTLLGTWAAQAGRGVAWLSLTEADRHADHLARGVAVAVAACDGLPPGPPEPVLIIDDVHLVGEDSRPVLRNLIEQPPSGLRIVLSGRAAPQLRLSRLIASGEAGRLGTDELPFTADEVDLVGRAIGHPISADRASRLHAGTGGWPVAVRLALIAGSSHVGGFRPPTEGQPIPELPEYLIESVLDNLPADLSEFVLPACTCDWLTGELAGALAGVPNGSEQLERAVAAGLPLERRGAFRGDPVYRWHPVMAQAAREILRRRDPERCRRLDLVAARAIGALDTFTAATHALRGRDPEFAAELLRTHWLVAVLRGESDQLVELCGRLPAPWSEDPEILAVEAACRRNAGDAAGALSLERRATATLHGPGARISGLGPTLSLARLFVLDDATALGVESVCALEGLSGPTPVDGVQRACALLLIGWTELRLRHARAALPILAEAVAHCRAEGLDDLADRARANLGFALAFVGDFRGAEAAVAETEAAGSESATWRRTDGAIEWFTRGWVAFWRGDPAAAMDAFQRAVDQGGGLISYAHLARCWLLDAAVDSGDPAAIRRVEGMLDDIPDQTTQGLPWAVYRGVAEAGLLVSRGSSDSAVKVLDKVIASEPGIPAANVQAAELYWRCGALDAARRQAALLRGEVPGYLRIGGLVVEALCERRSGAIGTAHGLLEEALALGAEQSLFRAFARPDPDLARLLAEHADLGTAHEQFLARALTRQHAAAAYALIEPLSPRELEVLGRLQTSMSTADIAAELHISANTLKSHLKAIYRKLGVDNRRDAVLEARRRGERPPSGSASSAR